MAKVELAGRAIPYDPETGTIDLSGRRGELRLTVAVATRPHEADRRQRRPLEQGR
jgi:hypothetical protein